MYTLRYLPFWSLRISTLFCGSATGLACLTLPSDTLMTIRWRLKVNCMICGLQMRALRDSPPSRQDGKLCLLRSLKMWQSEKIPRTIASQNSYSRKGDFPTHVTGCANQSIKRGCSPNYGKASVLADIGRGMQSNSSTMSSA